MCLISINTVFAQTALSYNHDARFHYKRMSLSALPPRAALGHSTWHLLHSTAKAVRTQAQLKKFAKVVAGILDLYPCRMCSNNSEASCAAHLVALHHISERGELLGAQTVAVAWVSRFHACVTTHLKTDASAIVSHESACIASKVHAAGDDDKAIFQLVTSL
jgi:hypothetical protein